MPKCKLNNGNVYSFTTEQYESILAAGIFIEKVEDDKKPEVLKDKIQPKEAKE
jgi:hypothetical protein